MHTLALRPPQPTIMKLLSQYRGALGIDVVDTPFQAKLVRREGAVIKIYTPPRAAWISRANCKALWLGEPSYRKKKTGSEEHVWGSTEDWKCLANLTLPVTMLPSATAGAIAKMSAMIAEGGPALIRRP